MTALAQRRILIGRIAVALGILVAWQAAANSLGPLLFAQPGEVFMRLVRVVGDGTLFRHAWGTLSLALSGFAAATVLGILLPVLLSFLPRARAAVAPYMRGGIGRAPV